MKIIQIEAYQSSDGEIFSNRGECEDHERISSPKNDLVDHIQNNCGATGADNCGREMFTEIDIADYIIDNLQMVNNLVRLHQIAIINLHGIHNFSVYFDADGFVIPVEGAQNS